jgi:uncharacterized membrane protein YdjX (TVP38/TMEM64 family)
MLSALSQYFLHWESFFHSLGFLGVLAFALAIILLQLLCLPLSPFGIMAGLFFGVANGFIAVELGTALGAGCNFLLSRYTMRERVARWLSGHEKFRLIDRAIGQEGWKIIALLRFCPIPFGLANYSFGLTAVGFGPYMLATVFAIIPANFFFVWFGATSRDLALSLLAGQAKTTPNQTIFTVVGVVAFFLALTYVGKIAKAAIARHEPVKQD